MFFSKKALLQRRHTPTVICKTPKSTESFIFMEFKKSSSFVAPAQAQSTPKGYGPGPPEFLVSYIGVNCPFPSVSTNLDSKIGSPMEKKSLYMNPAKVAKIPRLKTM